MNKERPEELRTFVGAGTALLIRRHKSLGLPTDRPDKDCQDVWEILANVQPAKSKPTYNDIGDPVEGIYYRPEWCEEVACDPVLCEQCGNEMGDYFGEAYQCGLCGDIVLKAPDCKG